VLDEERGETSAACIEDAIREELHGLSKAGQLNTLSMK
jgi:hypothetical protein